MITRQFGLTDLRVPVLGLGAGEIGDGALEESAVGRLLAAALDTGITLIDTARGYGLSETRIGRHLSHRRNDFILSTKVGYGIPGTQDWTYDCVLAGVQEACRNLKTEYIDIVHLHSCPQDVMRHAGVVDALEESQRRGLVRYSAYSGENEDLSYAVGTGRFSSIQCSVNVFDQQSLGRQIPDAQARGMGVVGKRPLANVPWKHASAPTGEYCEAYWHRMKAMGLEPELPWDELALRFAAFAPGVHTVIPGTTNVARLERNAEIVNRGPLPEEVTTRWRRAFNQCGDSWRGEI